MYTNTFTSIDLGMSLICDVNLSDADVDNSIYVYNNTHLTAMGGKIKNINRLESGLVIYLCEDVYIHTEYDEKYLYVLVTNVEDGKFLAKFRCYRKMEPIRSIKDLF